MSKTPKIDTFFKRKELASVDSLVSSAASTKKSLDSSSEMYQSKLHRVESKEGDINDLERDPGLRRSIMDYHVNQRDEIKRAYLKLGPYQPIQDYPLSGEKHPRRFQSSWFNSFSSWLEYSPTKDVAFCLYCYLDNKQLSSFQGSDTFISKGFRNWKKVKSGENCAFLTFVGKDSNSPHNRAMQSCLDLMNQHQHLEMIFKKQSAQEITNNRLRLKVTIDTVRWLAFQACAFRGHDETLNCRNRGNFIELIRMLASYNSAIDNVVLEKAPRNCTYTSPQIQKEILHILANKVRNFIRKEIGDSKFCIIVDEARDESKREQMAIILRYVDKDGFIQERFFDLIHVPDTTALTLKNEICKVFTFHNLDMKNLRDQGYDGASNMRGEWNGLKALFLNECPHAYYIHCFAHRLQLALVAASKEVIPIYHFFEKLALIINIVCASSKRHDELQAAQVEYISELISNDKIETGRGLNQIGTLQRAGDTRWGSHFKSIRSLMNLYDSVCKVLGNIINEGATYAQRGEADGAYGTLTYFEFIFILYLMEKLMGITDALCKALQYKSQDILNAMDLVSSTRSLIQKLRDDGWDLLLENVIKFCHVHNILVPDMSSQYISGRGRARSQSDHITMAHHYRVDIFLTIVDKHMKELNDRFDQQTIELLVLSSALDPRDNYKRFNIDRICMLAKFYAKDFTEQDILVLQYQLQHFECDVKNNSSFFDLSNIQELCQKLAETGKKEVYHLLDTLIRLVLTLPVSTATSERAFSAMNIVKTRIRNKMEDEFLADCLVIYIEKDIAEKISTESIIEDFTSAKERRAELM